MQYASLTPTKHGHLCRKQGTFFFLNSQPLVLVSVVEASVAALDLPLAFMRKEAGGLSLVALLSLKNDDNAQVGPKGFWMGGYMPAVVQAYPFALAASEGQEVVAVHEESDWLSSEEGQPLFTDDGEPSELLLRIMEMLKTRMPNAQRDASVLSAIEKSGLLQPWTEISDDLLRVAPAYLRDMDDDAFLELRKTNALDLVYAHLLSLRRVNRIRRLAQKKQKMQESLRPQRSQAVKDNLSFNLEDDTIRFGF
jgi:hypothetical protein